MHAGGNLTELRAPLPMRRARTGFRFEYDDFCDTRFNSGGWVGIPNVRLDQSHVSCLGPVLMSASRV